MKKADKRKPQKRDAVPQYSNGHIDPEWLGKAGLRVVGAWLRDRLAGHDPYQPIDVRVDEDPESFVAEVVRSVGVQHPASAAIAVSVLRLLDETRKPSVKPAFFPRLIRL